MSAVRNRHDADASSRHGPRPAQGRLVEQAARLGSLGSIRTGRARFVRRRTGGGAATGRRRGCRNPPLGL